MNIRSFAPHDIAACLAIFDSNSPDFFHPQERAEFEAFLNAIDGTYVVGVHNDAIVACGGYWKLPQAPIGILTWGMVGQRYHRQGFGRQLLTYRMQALREIPELVAVSLQTGPKTVPFFQKAGFEVKNVVENGIAPGIDQYSLVLPLLEQEM
jgi:GNAT superfamily N-acetyltransferase